MNSPIIYSISEKDLCAAYQLHFKKLKPIKTTIIFVISMAFIGFLGEFYYSLFFLFCFWILVMLFALKLLPKFAFRKNKKYRSNFSLEFNEEGVISKTDNMSSNIKWNFFTTYTENEDLVLLYYSKNGFTFFPKNIFKKDEDLTCFLDLIRKNIKKRI